MDFGFECPECGAELEAMDNDQLIEAMDDPDRPLRAELERPA